MTQQPLHASKILPLFDLACQVYPIIAEMTTMQQMHCVLEFIGGDHNHATMHS